MNSHNTKPTFAFHKTPVVTDEDRDERKIVSTSLSAADLTIAEDANDFCDPYNSTGKHVVLKAKLSGKKIKR